MYKMFENLWNYYCAVWNRFFGKEKKKEETELQKNIKLVKEEIKIRKEILKNTQEAPARMTKD